ncbi:PAS domain-containing protein [Nitrogeniibacter mangrovi]|uniref:PAS domain-containing protein n=1 Tax=Nitrogeniibacter mangrovi TaxID=2016596 RepID=A0A6C1B8Y2_9RHOO|nr:sigma 54-interacting transcriptional regulator [Nitrogeniibacter mangrovi]QID19198.1 PAS domain-containing protein [Nitrogeniibacter mangrovi]
MREQARVVPLNRDDASARLGEALRLFGEISEGTLSVDREARITWISEPYCRLLGIEDADAAIGRPVEEIIPESRMRQVVETGRPILLDLLNFGEQHFVVCRVPLKNAAGEVEGAMGFVFYDRVDYLKPILDRFQSLQVKLDQANAELARARGARYSLSSFIGVSPAIVELKSTARRFALREGAVLVQGETGVGKELLAHALHLASARASGPFVAVNMAAVPETLLESEFFGVAPGAFTGAERRARPGKFELADGGTLFLDEIGDMPAAIQAKFLRVLQEGEFEALGSNTVKHVNVRIVAATSQNLEAKVEAGAFRADLYYRLAVLPLFVPALRERPEDIPVIAERILDDIPKEPGFGGWYLTDSGLDVLLAHPWPGNVRELRNVLERATALAECEALDAAAIRRVMGTSGEADAASGAEAAGEPLRLADAVAQAEAAAIRAALARAGGDKSRAARLLGVSRSQLYAKLKAFGDPA